ncbi:MAG: hypothetical protein WC454_08695, partial [Phycisphaerae bacterium]
MVKTHKLSNKGNDAIKKRPGLHKTVYAVLALTVLIAIFGMGALIHNNVSFTSDEAFTTQVD